MSNDECDGKTDGTCPRFPGFHVYRVLMIAAKVVFLFE
jgi:hypothetical protein